MKSQTRSHYLAQETQLTMSHAGAVGTTDPSYSNWMRFVNCARNEAEQDMVAYPSSSLLPAGGDAAHGVMANAELMNVSEEAETDLMVKAGAKLEL